MKSKYLAKNLLDHYLGVRAYTPPAAVYLALFSTVEGLADGSLEHEIAAGGYARVPFTMPAAVNAAVGGQSVSTVDVDFAPATADWGAMVAWAVMDAATGGNVLQYGELPQYGDPAEYKKIWTGDGFCVQAGKLILSEK